MKKANAVIISNLERVYHVYPSNLIEEINTFLNLYEKILTEAELEACKEDLTDVEFIFSTWGMPNLSEEQIKDFFPSLKYVMYGAGSVQKFCRPFLAQNVRIFSGYGANAVAVADYASSQILLATKGYFQALTKYKKEGNAVAKAYGHKMPGNYGVKVAILGAGMTGRKVMEDLSNRDINFLVYDPYVSDEVLAKYNATRVTLEEAFKEAMVVSCHIANRPDNKGMLKYEHFASMQDDATFINTGRGAQVVEEDLIRALKENTTLTALLDVTEPEPVLPGSEFLTLENVFLTPHLAGCLGLEVARMGKEMIDQARHIVNNEPTSYEVFESMLATMA